jgi:type VI secretion system protein VasI
MYKFLLLIAIFFTLNAKNSCTKIISNELRLKCYDKYFDKQNVDSNVTIKLEKKEKFKNEWIISNEKSLMGDSTNVSLSVSGSRVNGEYGYVYPTLMIRCMNKKTDLYIATDGMYLGSKRQKVRLKFDNNKPFKKYWSSSVDGTALFNDHKTISLIKNMMQHNKMVVEFTPYGLTPVQSKFNIYGLKKSVQPLRKVCKW